MATDVVPLLTAFAELLEQCPKRADVNAMRRQLARLEAIEAAANRAAELIAQEHTAARPSGYVAIYEVDQPAYDVLKALDAALAAGAGVTTEGAGTTT